MKKSTFATLTLARFGNLQEAGAIKSVLPSPLFASVGVDARAAGTALQSRTAYKFCVLALHEDQSSAEAFYESHGESLGWIDDADEVWSAILRPIRHVGAVNFLNAEEPGLVYDCPAEAIPEGPLVIITSAGFNREGDWMERAKAFGEGVTAVRVGMTGLPGLQSQQSFFLEGVDGITVTLWKDFASVRNFAYGPGVHKDQLMLDKTSGLSDRTSFTRFVIERSEGTWHGSQPFN